MATHIATDAGCSVVLPIEGERIPIFDDEVVVKVNGVQTAGAYTLVTLSLAPGGGPPLHAHRGSETCYVLSGEFEFTVRDARGVSTFRVGPGAVVHAPSGAAHRFENVSPTRSTLLQVLSPELVDFLRQVGAAFPSGAHSDTEKMQAISAKHGTVMIYDAEGSRPEP